MATGHDEFRQRIVDCALAAVGHISDRGLNGERKGWELLREIFDLSLGPDAVARIPRYSLSLRAPGKGPNGLSWCGLFGVWAWQKAGRDDVRWTQGGKVTNVPFRWARDFGPGDLVQFAVDTHHNAIVKHVEGDRLTTIDGNAGPFHEVVERVTWKKSQVVGYFPCTRNFPPQDAPQEQHL